MKKKFILCLCLSIIILSQNNYAIIKIADSEARITKKDIEEAFKNIEKKLDKLDEKILKKTQDRLNVVKPLNREE